jgi:hypothetical protein
VHPEVERTLRAILREMEEEDHGAGGSWIERALDSRPAEVVEDAGRRWCAVDEAVAAELEQLVTERFPIAERRA